ncbi:uncharacterized protein V6R79_015234 [Siganus canaliculatus]
MECFNSLLLKLREVHEREIEAFQMKIQELSNKKGCDTKRMEELFSKNQQMREQQRLLTENIKTLENRLRAGLCDRCTVTQEVAKRRQQEFEASQMQSLQHISLLAGEMNNLKKENKRLREEIKNLRAALEGNSDHPTNNTTDVKSHSSPGQSPSSGAMPLFTAAAPSIQPAEEDETRVKTEVEPRAEESEREQWKGLNRSSHFDLYKPHLGVASSSWKTERTASRVGERRAQSVEGLDQKSLVHSQALLKSSASSPPREGNPSRHVLHVPVPCRPQPVKSSHVVVPWSSPSGTSLVVQPSPKLNLQHFPSLMATSQHGSPQRQSIVSLWPKQSTLKPSASEPTVLFRFKSLPGHVESPSKPPEKKEVQPSKAERVSGEGLREVYDGPLDLSDRGKSKSSQFPGDYSPLILQSEERGQNKDLRINTRIHVLESPPHHDSPHTSPSTPPLRQHEEPPTDPARKQVIRVQEHKEEMNGSRTTDQEDREKAPVLTVSLRPVVVLETLNSALQKQESASPKDESPSPAAEMESSTDEPDNRESESGREFSHGSKRRRPSEESDSDADSGTDNILHKKKTKVPARPEESSPS